MAPVVLSTLAPPVVDALSRAGRAKYLASQPYLTSDHLPPRPDPIDGPHSGLAFRYGPHLPPRLRSGHIYDYEREHDCCFCMQQNPKDYLTLKNP